jgi:primosomal protein N' (replication factor Y) (superfamily II helicase)
MERSTYFVDVVIPQALPQYLTYRVPQTMNDQIQVGQRIIVQLGKTKLLTAIIRRIHKTAPARYEAKYIEAVLDEQPLIHETQLNLWEWIATYYCCTTGEVMNAALPAGLKLSSETKFYLNPEWHTLEFTWSDQEQLIISVLQVRGSATVDDVAQILQKAQVQSVLKGLIEKMAISSEEELREKFKPRTTDFVHLGSAADSEEKLQAVFADLEKRRSQKQSDTLMVFLQMCKWDEGKKNEVPRLKLQEASKVNASVISAMTEKGIFRVETRETGRLASHLLASDRVKELSPAQQEALLKIKAEHESKDVVLLHGVTSSGKTEVYASLIEQTIAEGKQVLFLLPEIALTTQIIHRLRKYFGKRVGVYHSGYSDNERTEVWNKVLSDVAGECDIILGARSALFLPFKRLGLIIVDEEHEQSFKQHDPAPRYHARDTAIWLAKQFGAKVLLGSATPAVETYWNAKQGRFGLVSLTERFGGMELPEIDICDLRPDTKAKTMKNNFSTHLVESIQLALQSEEQVILFQNRRGYTPLWECQSCGWVPQCTRCDVSLTYHKQQGVLKCHYCGYSTPPVQACHACGSTDVKMIGFGTEKIEEDIELFIENARPQRLDLETTRSKTGYQKIIGDFESGHTNILVGTQMVTKGLDFDNVSLVGIINADKMLHYPDFRSVERSYQLIMQVAGRAGRKNKRGKVIIQTFTPQHWLLEMIKDGTYELFYEKEIRERHHFGYPPFVRMMRVTLKHKEDDVVEQVSIEMSKVLRAVLGDKLLGPEKPYIPRINNYYLRQLLIKMDKRPESLELKSRLVDMMKQVLLQPQFRQVRLALDVDPI